MPHKLFCFIQWLAFFISATLIFCKGFGSREVYDVSIGFFVSVSLFFARRKFFIIYILLLAIHIAFSGISLLWGFVFILFSLNKHTFHYSVLALVLWSLEAIDIIPNNIFHIVILVAVSNILTFFSEKHKKNCFSPPPPLHLYIAPPCFLMVESLVAFDYPESLILMFMNDRSF